MARTLGTPSDFIGVTWQTLPLALRVVLEARLDGIADKTRDCAMSAHVSIRDLSKRYGAVAAVRGVSLTIARGEIFGLLGPNGAGKTTTLECLVGLREPDAGEIFIGGLDLRRQPAAAKEKIGVAPQSPSLPGRITPREALHLFGSFYRQAVGPGPLLTRFDLTAQADRPVETLSGGQRQRLSLALAFVNQPELVVLDEPTSGLDPQARREIRDEIVRMKGAGHTVLLSTHELAEAEQVCDRIAILDHGRVIATGTPRELVAQAKAPQTVTLVTARRLDPTLLARLAAGAAVTLDGDTARWDTTDAAATLAGLAALLAEHHVGLVDLQMRPASLESVFLRLTAARTSPEGPLS
ncbi:MAG: ABC transporter ATP-binding protein [Verrucomicrobiota bacterium]